MQVAEISSMEKISTTTTDQSTMEEFQSVYERLGNLASANAVVIFAISCCCMCHVVKQLLFGLGVAPTVIDIDRDKKVGPQIHALLYHLAGDGGQCPPVPAIFIGGKFLGGVQTLLTCHINGSLVPLLKEAGALWL